MKAKTLVLTGYGINCEEETRYAFERAGADAHVVHINDLIANKKILDDCNILAFPGGFSYGDDTGSGKAFANRIINNLFDEFSRFLERDVLILGICNGFQIISNLGIVPHYSGLGKADVSLEHNARNRYICRWVDLAVNSKSNCVFTKGINTLHIPVAHGEGNFYADAATLEKLKLNNQITMQYATPDGKSANGEFPFNPNGATLDIASVCDASGRFMGLMPHPERGMFFTQREDWTLLKEQYIREGKDIPEYSDGIKIFRNAMEYFK
jgi:phosphoribosylformylglycinamidine synthase subunit PurQ / glutaminase